MYGKRQMEGNYDGSASGSRKKNRRTLRVVGLSTVDPLDQLNLDQLAGSLTKREKLLRSFVITDHIIYVEFTKGRNFVDWPRCFYMKHGIEESSIKSDNVRFCDLYDSFDKNKLHLSHNFNTMTLERVMTDEERHRVKTRTLIFKTLSPTDLLQTGLCSAEKFSTVNKFKQEINRMELTNETGQRKWIPPASLLTLRFKHDNAVDIIIPALRYECEKGCKYYYQTPTSHGVRFEDIVGFDNDSPVLRKTAHVNRDDRGDVTDGNGTAAVDVDADSDTDDTDEDANDNEEEDNLYYEDDCNDNRVDETYGHYLFNSETKDKYIRGKSTNLV